MAFEPSFHSLLHPRPSQPNRWAPPAGKLPACSVPISSRSHAPVEPLRNASPALQAFPTMQHIRSIALLLVLAFAGAQASVVDTVAGTPELSALLAPLVR